MRELPHSLTRIISLAILKRRYRFEVLGFENLPHSGAVLLLGNHTSWVDWALAQVVCPRQVRFVLEQHVATSWFMKLFFKLTGTAAISGKGKKAQQKITELLQQGEVVCLFPEEGVSGNGQLGEFGSAYEQAAAAVENGIIIPFYLRGLWGSSFSRANEGLRDSRAPSLRRDLIIAFGKPLPLDTKADYLKQKVFDLSITAWESYTKTLDPLPGTSFKIVDPDSCEELPLGEDGMILISGNQVMLGYLHNETKTQEVIFEQDGMRWYITGDKGHITPEGFLVIVDRYSRFAKIGGEMVSLGNIEEQARSVLEEDSEEDLAAAAVPDARKGEQVIMLVTSSELQQSLRQNMIAAGIAPLMIPSQVLQVDEVPRLGSGKTDFSALNKLAVSLVQYIS